MHHTFNKVIIMNVFIAPNPQVIKNSSPEFWPSNVRNPSQITLQIKLEPMRKLTTKK
jgi:hypothetical protein